MSQIQYYTNGDGRWYKTTRQDQCPEEVFLSGQCQGSVNHKGNHWCYRGDGSYAWDRNETDPDSWLPRSAAGWTPPDHESWPHPRDKFNELYTKFRETAEVTDLTVIEGLNNGTPPIGEEDAMIDTPLTEEDIKWLKESGRLDGILDEEG